MRFHFSIPLSVRIVSYLFGLSGLANVGKFVIGLFFRNGEIVLSDLLLGVLEINIAAGLLDFSRFWRFIALAFIAVRATLILISAVLSIFFVSPNGVFRINPLGLTLFETPAPIWLLIPPLTIAALIYYGWQWWALDRPAIRNLFFKPKALTTN